MKNTISKISVMLSAVMLTGCFPTGEVVIPDGGLGMDELLAMAEGVENLSLDLTLPADYPDEVPQVTVKVREWDNDRLREIFIDGKNIIEQYEYESDLFPEETYYVYYTDDGYVCGFEPGHVFLRHNEKNNAGYDLFTSMFYYYHCEDMLTADSLDGFPLSDATGRVNELLDNIGISNYSEPYVYAVSAEKANMWLEKEAHKQKELWGEDTEVKTWGEENEAYILRYPLQYGYIPVETDTVTVKVNYAYLDTYIEAIVTRDDIISLDCRGIYSEEYETGPVVSINWSPTDALSRLITDLSKAVITDPLTFYDCRFVYAPTGIQDDGSVILSPVWHFEYAKETEISAEDGGIKRVEYINAQTGNKIA